MTAPTDPVAVAGKLTEAAERCEEKALGYINDFVKSPAFSGGYLSIANELLDTAFKLRRAHQQERDNAE